MHCVTDREHMYIASYALAVLGMEALGDGVCSHSSVDRDLFPASLLETLVFPDTGAVCGIVHVRVVIRHDNEAAAMLASCPHDRDQLPQSLCSGAHALLLCYKVFFLFKC